jgi:hypothetical protein
MVEIMTETEIDAALAGLKKLGHDQSSWDTLYRDPATGKLWEVTYPESQRHGGGPTPVERDLVIGRWRQICERSFLAPVRRGALRTVPTIIQPRSPDGAERNPGTLDPHLR